ncbi:YidB family protein [Methylobacterium sp. Leaf118]|uniref:YidB family protein n=1 Tax=Methylobacterium sp. Leaf118 TaxID=2876562 RepID=UPI001E52F870|nr:YidB family protein [Methylobacterium sp. Leaf118]
MGLLDQVIGGVVGQVLGGGRGGALASPVVKALLMLLLAKGASGGLGDIFGGGRGDDRAGPAPREPDRREPEWREPDRDDGDLGGFGQGRGGPPQERSQGGDPGGGAFSDLAGMLDGPGDRGPGERGFDDRDSGAGPYARLDRDGAREAGAEASGLDGLIHGFERSGLGDVLASWIGHGPNQPLPPNRLADALGPDTVTSLSRETGLSRDDLLAQLAQALPGVIDALTPQGRAPGPDERRGW